MKSDFPQHTKKKFTEIKIDVGLDDEFLEDLYLDDFVEACNSVDQKLSLNKHQGYDHGYYFIHSFILNFILFIQCVDFLGIVFKLLYTDIYYAIR